MSDIVKAFEKTFGTSDILHPRKSFPRRGMTSEQRKFCSFLSLDTYKDKHGNMRRELIALLIQRNGQIKVEELRRLDFSKIERYRQSGVEHPISKMFPKMGNWMRMQGYEGDGYYRFFWRFGNHFGVNECDVHCDPIQPLQKLKARDVIDCLHNATMNMNAGAVVQISKLHDTLDKQLQEAGEDVFIYELLQNANDYPYENNNVHVEFRLLKNNGCLLFCHTGAEFSEKNVAALCSANDQDKSDNISAIGYKGIGFKTVFRYNNRVEVNSGRFGFFFDKKIQRQKDGIPWRTTPSWVHPEVWDGYRVDIRLFPSDIRKLSDGEGSYAQQLKGLFTDERPLLFIPRVQSVKLYLEDWDNPIVRSKNNDKWCLSEQLVLEVAPEIRRLIDEELNNVDHCRIPPKYRHLERTAVSFACRRNGRRLLPENNANLYCYLPAKDAQWGFRFLMNTDMIPNGPRNDIEYSIEVNKYFARVAGEKFFEWIDSLIRSGEYDYDSIFALIPDFFDCKKNRQPKVVEFIDEFQKGFEKRLPGLQIPSSKGNFDFVSSIVYDSTGILKELGESVWERLEYGGTIPHKTLRACKDFDLFVRRYKVLLQIQEFGFENLVKAVDSESFQKWLENPVANQQFFKYLDGKDKLNLFKSAKIFLDDKGDHGVPKEMYFHADVEKYLKDFAYCFRYLPSSAPCRDRLEKNWFIQLVPGKLVYEILFSNVNDARTRERLKNVRIARKFFGFLARYKTFGQTNCQSESFTRGFLEKLPVVLENGETVNAIVADEYSIFLSEQVSAQSIVADYSWIDQGWVRFLNAEYFDWEDGPEIRKWLLEEHKQGDKAWKLVYSWSRRDVLTAIVNKFIGYIRKRMIDLRSDLGFYDFICKCIEEECINLNGIKQQLSGWPVFDADEVIVESSDKAVFYCNDCILHWATAGWLDDKVLVLNKKYSAQKKLFDILGVQEFREDNFGEIFRTSLASHLNLDSREKVIAFHRFMAMKKDEGRFVTNDQVRELKNVKVLFRGKENPIDGGGIDGVYLPPKKDIDSAIADGIISSEIKILDDVLCGNDVVIEYWKWLGARSLDEVEIFKKRLEQYLERQNQFLESGGGDADFKEHHKIFIGVLASRDALQTLKDGGSSDALKKICLFAKDGKLRLPTEMRFSNEYMPLCDFESFDKNGAYVEEMYCGIEGIKELFKELGVKDRFSKDDVALLASTEFCKYFWTKYLNNNSSEWKEIKDCLKANLPCVLDRTGAVRKPEELYHLAIEDYVLRLPDSEARLPMVDGIGKDCLSELEMRTTLSVEDSLAFLLADSECKMYKMRGRVLQWIAECSTAVSRDLVEEYRNNERAIWRNGQKNFVSIKDLCAICRKNSGRVRLFANDPHVMDMTGLGTGGGDADVMRAKAEDALQWLGVKFIDDDSIDVIPADDRVEDRVISDIAVRMLVFLAERYPDGWEQEFSDMYSQLKNIKFLKSSGLVVRCKDNDWLRAEHGTFLSKGDSFYFVDDWQSKFVYGDMIAELWEKIFKKKYSLDDLKIALDTSGGDEQLASKICSDRVRIVENESFMHKLQELSPSVYGLVIDQLRVPSDTSNQLVEKELSEPCSTKDEQMFVGVSETGIVRSVEAPCASEIAEPAHRKIGQYEVEEDEYEQIQRLFEDGVSESGDMENRKKDESKLACLQIFNYLKNKGLGKMELLIAPLCRYFGLGDKDRELLGILVSRTSAELDEYFKDKGCAEDLLNKVKQVVVSQNKTSYSDGEAVISASVTDGRYAGLSNDDKHSALMEAKEMVMEKLQRKGFEFTQGICENEFSIINGVKKDGVEYPLVVRSYKDSSRPFSLNAADWQQLMKPNSILLVCTNEGVCTVPFKDLICNREQINFTISTANNLDMSDRIAKLTNELRWFKGLRFDFGSLIPMQTSTVQLFDLPENSIPENQKESQMSQDAESEVF